MNCLLLIIEDSVPYSKYLRALIEQNCGEHKFFFSAAYTMEGAMLEIDKMETGDKRIFDCILLDLNLPDSTGFETLEKMNGRCEKSAIVVITGSVSFDTRSKAIEMGAQAFLLKDHLKHDKGGELISIIETSVDNKRRLNNSIDKVKQEGSLLDDSISKLQQAVTQGND